MARTIDEKVVEMRFDNRDFESNVSQSMSTLDKLKSALNFDGVEKAFSGISSAADKVNLRGMSDALDGVSEKFTALETVAVGALLNIGSKVSDLALDTVKSLTLDQVTAGFDKYASKTKAVQTIMNATGLEIGEVSDQLDRLNWYTDETSYSFEDMVNNIGKFTSNGVALDKAVTAMEGISNLAAISGQGRAEAGRAMYNLSQALSSGYLMARDWMSIEYANMATKEFKEMAIQAALAEGTLKEFYDQDTGEKFFATFTDGLEGIQAATEVTATNMRETLKDKWFNDKVLIRVLSMYGEFTDKLSLAYDEINSLEGVDVTTSQIIKMTNQFVDGTLNMEQAMMMTGRTAEELTTILSELGKDEYELGRRALSAAQEAKTFQEAIDGTKDAVSTGFMNTFEILFGNYEEAKVLWTDLANELWNIFAGPIRDMNDMLTGWKRVGGRDYFIQSLKDIYHALRSFVDPIKEAWDNIFPDISSSEMFNITRNFQAFTNSLKLSEEAAEEVYAGFEGIFKVFKLVGDVLKDILVPYWSALLDIGNDLNGGLFGIFGQFGDWLSGIVDSIRGSDRFIDFMNRFQLSAHILGESLHNLFRPGDLVGVFQKNGGGIGGFVATLIDMLQDANRGVAAIAYAFSGKGEVFGAVDRLNDKLNITVEKVGEVVTVFERKFGKISDIFKPILDAIKTIGSDFLEGIVMLFEDVGTAASDSVDSLNSWLDWVKRTIKSSDDLENFVNNLKDGISAVSEFAAHIFSLKGAVQIFRDAGGGLSGIASVITDRLGDVLDLIADIIQRVTGIDLHGFGNIVTLMFGGILTAVTKVIGAVKSFFDLFKKESTKDLDEFGEKTEKKFSPIRSLFEGLKSVFEGIWNILKQLSPVFGTITGKIGEAFGKLGEGLKNADLNKFFDVANKGLGLAFGAGIVKFVHSLSKPFGETKGLFDSLKGIIDQITDVLDGVKNALKAWQNDLNAKALLKIAAAIGIITLSVIGLSNIDPGKLGSSIAAITLLFSELIGAMTANNKLNANAKGSNMNKIGIAMIEMAASVLIMSNALKKVAELDWDEILKGVVGLGIVLAEMTLAINNMPKDKVKGGFVMIEMAAALLIAANALKQIGELSWGEIAKGLVGMGIALAEMTAALAILGNFGGSTFGKGLELILVAASLKIIASALTDFGSMQWDEIARGLIAMGGALLEVSGTLLLIGNLGQKILSTSISLVIVGAALKIIASAVTDFGSMQWDEIARGLVAMGGALLEISAVLIILGSLAQNALANSAALVLVGVSLNIIADALKNFAGLEWEEIAKGLIAMGGALFEIVAALLLMGNGGGLAGAAAMIVVAAALAMLAPVLQSLGEMSLAEIGKSLLELAGVFAIIGVAGLLLGPISPMILALAGAVALLGIGVTGIGAGLLMFSAGLTALAAAGTGAIELLVTAIKEILNLIPLLLTKVGEGIVALITVIGESATTIAKEVVKVASAILDAAGVLIPKLVELVVTIIDEVLKTIATHSGSIIESCATILLELLNGIATYLPDFIQAGVDIVLSLIEGLGQGIVDNAERAREAFTNLFKGIVEAILIFLGVDKDKAEEFVNIAGDMINGLTSGIAEFAMNAFLAIGEFMTNLVEKVKEKLPEFIDRGKEIIDNLKEGFTSKVEEAVEALKTVVGKIIDGAKSVVSKAKDLGKSIIDKIKGGTEEPESKETAQNVGKSVGDNVAKGLEKSSDTTIRKAAKKVINQAVNSMKQEAAISSPSEVTREEVGQYLGAGVASGLFDSVPGCEAKAKDLMSKVTGTMKKDEFLKEAQDAGFDIGAGYFDGLFQNEEDISEIGGDFVTTFAESAVSNKMEAYDAGTDVGGSICDGLVSQYGSMLSAGEYDASGAIAGISSYAEGGDNAWYTQDVTTDFVTTVADGMVSNVDLVEGAGRTMAEAAQDGFLGAGWNEFQQKAFEPFKEAFEGISGYASDPWFVMNNDQLDEYTSNLKKRLDGISDSTTSVTRVVQYGDMQLANDELEAYQMGLDPSSARAFGYLMNGFDAVDQVSVLQAQLDEERMARENAEAKLAEQSSHGERWLEAINGNIEDLKNKNTDIYLDTGVLAGGTYQKTDELMGTRWTMSRRGV